MIKFNQDIFNEMLESQRKFQEAQGNDIRSKNYMKEMGIALVDEIREIREKHTEIIHFAGDPDSLRQLKKELKFEIIDALFFNLNLFLYIPRDQLELFTPVEQPYMYKNTESNGVLLDITENLMLGLRAGAFKSWRGDQTPDYNKYEFYMFLTMYEIMNYMDIFTNIFTMDDIKNLYYQKLTINKQRQKGVL